MEKKMTIKFVFSAILILTSAVSAESLKEWAQKNKSLGINQKIEIQSFGRYWGQKLAEAPFPPHRPLVPVTREAADVLQNLDLKRKYICTLQNSTLVDRGEYDEGSYYVLDIQCE